MTNKKILNNALTTNVDNFNEAHELSKRSSFSRREVGLTHPDTSAFVRLNDKGDVEIFAGEELGIVISPSSRSISIFADVVKIVTKEDYGLRWNNMSFNYAGDIYNEPSLVHTSEKEHNSGFNYADYYLDALGDYDDIEKSDNITTITGDFAFVKNPSERREESPTVNNPSVISKNDMVLLKEFSLTNSTEKVRYMTQLLESGFTFSQAREKTMRDKGV
jgi:hypothetical protein